MADEDITRDDNTSMEESPDMEDRDLDTSLSDE